MDILLVEILVVVSCLLLSAFFSSSETALMRLGVEEAEKEAENPQGPASIAVRDLLSSTSHLLVTILLGNNLVNILAAAAASAMAIRYLGETRGIVVATVVMTIVVLVFCEVLPKAVAARHPRGIAHFVGLPIYVLHQILRPVHWLFDRGLEPLVRRIVGGSERSETSTESILRLARASRARAAAGTPLAIIGATAGAAEMNVAEIMVPRTEIEAFPSDIEPAALLGQMIEERYTRVPIFQGSIDDVLGLVHLKELVKLVHSGGTNLREILKPVLRVPARKPILRLLAEMQRGFIHLAIVKDEFGVTQGLVTQEDILEEIVGEIRDEFDLVELETIQPAGDESYVALGRVKVLDFGRATGWKIPARRGDSLGGLVFNTLGHSPKRGEVARIPGFELTVTDVSGSRITRVRVTRQPDPIEARDESVH